MIRSERAAVCKRALSTTRVVGRRRTPLLAGVAQNAVNLSLDLLLVLGMGVGIVRALLYHFCSQNWEGSSRRSHAHRAWVPVVLHGPQLWLQDGC
jgi:uncharacterized membrane-anchored protein